ncbi:MAG: hypothetical protein AAF806_09395 [Bacteroidota bacterium]
MKQIVFSIFLILLCSIFCLGQSVKLQRQYLFQSSEYYLDATQTGAYEMSCELGRSKDKPSENKVSFIVSPFTYEMFYNIFKSKWKEFTQAQVEEQNTKEEEIIDNATSLNPSLALHQVKAQAEESISNNLKIDSQTAIPPSEIKFEKEASRIFFNLILFAMGVKEGLDSEPIAGELCLSGQDIAVESVGNPTNDGKWLKKMVKTKLSRLPIYSKNLFTMEYLWSKTDFVYRLGGDSSLVYRILPKKDHNDPIIKNMINWMNSENDSLYPRPSYSKSHFQLGKRKTKRVVREGIINDETDKRYRKKYKLDKAKHIVDSLLKAIEMHEDSLTKLRNSNILFFVDSSKFKKFNAMGKELRKEFITIVEQLPLSKKYPCEFNDDASINKSFDFRFDKSHVDIALAQVQFTINQNNQTTNGYAKVIDSLERINLQFIQNDTLSRCDTNLNNQLKEYIEANDVKLSPALRKMRDIVRAQKQLEDKLVVSRNSLVKLANSDRLKNYQAFKNSISDTYLGRLEAVVARSNSDTTEIKRIESTLEEAQEELTLQKSTITEHDDKFLLKLDKVNVEFNNGFIENVIVIGDIKEGDSTIYRAKFENYIPLGFSDKFNFSNIKLQSLYCSRANGDRYKLDIQDLIENYYQVLAVGRYDYSPRSSIVEMNIGQGEYCAVLKKEKTYQILQANIFSDFVGLDASEPNGLIQTEIRRIIPLFTPIQFSPVQQSNRSTKLFRYIEPILTLSKIESQNRVLPLINQGDKDSSLYQTTLQLKRREQLFVGATLNFFAFSVPNIKTNFYANAGGYFGRTPVADLSGQEFGVNTFQFTPEVICEITPDERYKLQFRYTHNFLKLRDKRIRQVERLKDLEGYKEASLLNRRNSIQTIEILAQVKPNENANGQFFFRYRYNLQRKADVGFQQAQIGYSFNLLGRFKELK